MKKIIFFSLLILILTDCKTKPFNFSKPSASTDSIKDISDLKMVLMDSYITKAKDLLGEPDLDDNTAFVNAHYFIYYNKVMEDGKIKDLLIYCVNDDDGSRLIKNVLAVNDGDRINIPNFGSVLIQKPVAPIASINQFRQIDKYVATIDSNNLHCNSFRNESYETKVYTSNAQVVLMTLTGFNTVPGNKSYDTKRYYFENGALVYMYESDNENLLLPTTLYIMRNNIVKYLVGKKVYPCSEYVFGCSFDETTPPLRYLASFKIQQPNLR
jgi:hypothetical protein